MLKPISSSAATGLFLDLLKKYGADAFVTRFAAVMLGSTETIFYTISVYFMSVNIKKTRYTLVGGLIATFAGVVASLIMTRLFF
jgi:spore maturation protein B